MTVLIVESSLLISGRMRNLLLESEHARAIYQSVSHKKAELLFEEVKPQVVLLDMNLPGNTTIELLKKIKEKDAGTSVIALVNCEDKQKQLKCAAEGADFILDKYHEFEKIPVIIDAIVSDKNPEYGSGKSKYYPELADAS